MLDHDLEFPVTEKLPSISADVFFSYEKQISQPHHFDTNQIIFWLYVSLLCFVGYLAAPLAFTY